MGTCQQIQEAGIVRIDRLQIVVDAVEAKVQEGHGGVDNAVTHRLTGQVQRTAATPGHLADVRLSAHAGRQPVQRRQQLAGMRVAARRNAAVGVQRPHVEEDIRDLSPAQSVGQHAVLFLAVGLANPLVPRPQCIHGPAALPS